MCTSAAPRELELEHTADRNHQGPPQHFQARRIEYDLAMGAADILAYPSHPGGGDPSPTDDGYSRNQQQHMPADIDQRTAVKGDGKPLSVRTQIRSDPSHRHPGQVRLNWNDNILQEFVARRTNIDCKRHRDEDVPDVADLTGEAEIGPLRHAGGGRSSTGRSWLPPRAPGPPTEIRSKTTGCGRGNPIDQGQSKAPRHGRRNWPAERRSAEWRVGSRRFRTGRNLRCPLPARHSLAPDQRILGDRAPGDQFAELGVGIRALLLAVGCIKPGSVCHIIPFRC